MSIKEKRDQEIKENFGMWMYESFQTVVHIHAYNFAKLDIKDKSGKPEIFTRSEMMDMGIAIFNKRVDLELQKTGNGNG